MGCCTAAVQLSSGANFRAFTAGCGGDCGALIHDTNKQSNFAPLLIACCRGGQVGDQEAQLRYSNQQRAGGLFDHITSLKDVFTLHLTPNPQLQQQRQQHECGLAAAGSSSTAAASVQQPVQSSSSTCGTGSMDVPPWVCPVTLLPCGGKQPFSALKRCGHVLSDKAFAAVTAAEHSCSVCGAAFSSKDVVQINGSQEHLDTMRQQLRAKAAAKAAAKKAKVAEQLGVPSKRAHELTGPDSSTHATAIADSGKKQRMLEGRLQAAEVALMERQQA